MRRLILVPAGVLLAFVGSTLALLSGLVVEAMRLPAEAAFGMGWIAAVLQAGAAGTLGLGLSALWTALVASCLVPVVLVATVGEAVQQRSFLWSAGGTAILTAAVPTLLRTAKQLPTAAAMSAHEGRFTGLLFLTGVVAGTLYWLVAGAKTGGAQ